MLTVHHLGISQSERIVWLCEELAIPYDLERYERDPVTRLAQPDYKALHPIGAAPVITDGDLVMAESGAIMDYIAATYGDGGLTAKAGDTDFAEYLYWFHFTNGTLQPALGRIMVLGRGGVADDAPVMLGTRQRIGLALGLVESRLGTVPWLAGAAFSMADIMIVFTLTTMRYFQPLELAPYPNILAYLQRVAARPAYAAAMAKGDPGMVLLLT